MGLPNSIQHQKMEYHHFGQFYLQQEHLLTNQLTFVSNFSNFIDLFQILYCMKSVFLLKYVLGFLTKVFYIQILFKCATLLLLFLIRTMVYRKKILDRKNSFFAVDYVKIIELHIVRTWHHMQSEQKKLGDVTISTKKINKS